MSARWTIALGSGLRWAIDQMGPQTAARMQADNVNWLRENKIDRLEANAIYAIGHALLHETKAASMSSTDQRRCRA